ncbi:hypothetical protein V2G26_011712 [Clonostachys chloroleuca]
MVTLKEKFAYPGPYRPIYRKWVKTARKAVWWLMLWELFGTVAGLVIFGISQPNLYRTDMWKIGWDNKLNSNPNVVLYAYANYEPLPKIALVWTRTFTDFNVAISVLSLFMLLAKLTAWIMRVWFPILACFINMSMATLYLVSLYGNIGPDFTDPRYPAPVAWYLRYGCEMARPYKAYKSCQIAQSAVFISAYMSTIYLIGLGFSIHAMLPNKSIDCPRKPDDDDDDDNVSHHSSPDWEMGNMKNGGVVTSTPFTPGPFTPFTPRTQAFNTLDHNSSVKPEAGRYA